MQPVKTGQSLRCENCGVELEVIKDCDTTCACNVICCGQPMTIADSDPEKAIE